MYHKKHSTAVEIYFGLSTYDLQTNGGVPDYELPY